MAIKSKDITIIVVMVVIVGFCLLVDSVFFASDRIANNSARHIENLGGGVVFDSSWGARVCHHVFLDDTDATDSDMKHVQSVFPHHRLTLNNTKVTDAGLQYLHGLYVYEIDLTGTKVTPAGIEELRQSLQNEHCRITFR